MQSFCAHQKKVLFEALEDAFQRLAEYKSRHVLGF